MFIIFIAHTPGNSWNDWIPARFGFSSGTELFVFCSGFASAGAFGRVFQQRGWFWGTAKVWKRIWQIYWVQMCLALASIALAYMFLPFVGVSAFERFSPLIEHGPAALFALVTLRWLPDFLDILPMYLVILALLPVLELLAVRHTNLPILVSALLWACVQVFGINLSGNPWTGSDWFLNPFAWQFCFVLGYSFGLRRLACPAWGHKRLMFGSFVFLLVSFFCSFQPIVDQVALLRDIQSAILPETAKTNLAPVRILHFVVLAYVAIGLVTPFATRLDRGPTGLLVRIGQQSLAAFVMGILAAELCGFVLQVLGGSAWIMLAVNVFGFCILLATAFVVAWFKREDWSRGSSKA